MQRVQWFFRRVSCRQANCYCDVGPEEQAALPLRIAAEGRSLNNLKSISLQRKMAYREARVNRVNLEAASLTGIALTKRNDVGQGIRNNAGRLSFMTDLTDAPLMVLGFSAMSDMLSQFTFCEPNSASDG